MKESYESDGSRSGSNPSRTDYPTGRTSLLKSAVAAEPSDGMGQRADAVRDTYGRIRVDDLRERASAALPSPDPHNEPVGSRSLVPAHSASRVSHAVAEDAAQVTP